MRNTQQQSLLRLSAAGIGIYSPHTSIDGASGGVNDWLVTLVGKGQEKEITPILRLSTPVDGIYYHAMAIYLIQGIRGVDMAEY